MYKVLGKKLKNEQRESPSLSHESEVNSFEKPCAGRLCRAEQKTSRFLCGLFKRTCPSGGFTLVETLIAVLILSLAITGPMFIAQKGIESSIYARDEITAFYLAQEGIEYIRSVRDSNNANGINWLSYITFNPNNGADTKCFGKCTIDTTILDYTNSSAIVSRRGSVPLLKFEPNSLYYGYGSGSSWVNTIFTRWVTVTEINPGVEAVVSVTMQWKTGLFATFRQFILKEHIFND